MSNDPDWKFPTDEESAEIIRQIRERIHAREEGSSSLSRFFKRHHAELVETFQVSPPRWRQLAEDLANKGLRDAKGQLPSETSARLIWSRVHRRVEASKPRTALPVQVWAVEASVKTPAKPALPEMVMRLKRDMCQRSGRRCESLCVTACRFD